MKILLVEPFFTGSHKQWAESYQHSSQHNVDILSMKGRHWKWRMHGGAIHLAEQYLKKKKNYDLILATDMLDVSIFMAITRKKLGQTPVAIYFHENQLTYPWSPTDQDVKLKRDNHYAFINISSALSANRLLFNSNYHLNSFFDNLPSFFKQFPDYNAFDSIDLLKSRAEVLPLGLELKQFDRYKCEEKESLPVILWNHRWEYDKNPTIFFELLFKLKENNIPFKLVVLGASFKKIPEIFIKAKTILKDEILHFGYCENFEEYCKWLWKADILPVTSNQDFFGGSVVEAIYCNTFPILPNRLAYPEHIPIEKQTTHLFNDDKNLYKMTKDALLSFKKNRNDTYQNFVTKYAWFNLASKYDNCFNHISQTN